MKRSSSIQEVPNIDVWLLICNTCTVIGLVSAVCSTGYTILKYRETEGRVFGASDCDKQPRRVLGVSDRVNCYLLLEYGTDFWLRVLTSVSIRVRQPSGLENIKKCRFKLTNSDCQTTKEHYSI